MYGCESRTIKKAEHQRTDAFELWCWRRLLRAPRTAKRSNQSILKEIRSDQIRSVVQSCLTLCDPMNRSTPGLPVHQNSWSLLKLMSIDSVMPPNHLILCHPLLLPPSIFPSIRVFSNKSILLIRWPKYWNFSFCHQSFQ